MRLLGSFRVGDHKANSRVFSQDSKNECQGIIEELSHTQTEEETPGSLKARDIGAFATHGSFTHTDQKKNGGMHEHP
jgi:hypothetical protein